MRDIKTRNNGNHTVRILQAIFFITMVLYTIGAKANDLGIILDAYNQFELQQQMQTKEMRRMQYGAPTIDYNTVQYENFHQPQPVIIQQVQPVPQNQVPRPAPTYYNVWQ